MNKQTKGGFTLFNRISLEDKINFSRHLALITRAGLPLLEGLKIIRRQARSRSFRNIIDHISTDVNNGQSLADALKRYPHVFGDFYISIVEVGEASGTLVDNLFYLSEELKKSKMLKNKVRAAMIYPAILFVMTVIVTGFLTFYVFPKLLGVFDELGVDIPLTTKILIAILTFLRVYFFYLIGGAVALFIVLKLLARVEGIKYILDWMLVRIPVLRTLVVTVSVVNFARILGLLLKSGIKIIDAIVIVRATFENLVYRRSLEAAIEEVKRGGSLALFLTTKPEIYPTIFTAMIEVGENTGNLEENLIYLSDYYTEEIDTSLKNLTALIEPLILLIMGLIVGFVALSIITPIYSLTQSLSQ